MYIDVNAPCEVCGKAIKAADLVIDSSYRVCSIGCYEIMNNMNNSQQDTIKQP